MPIDDVASRTLRAAGLGYASRAERSPGSSTPLLEAPSYRLGFRSPAKPASRSHESPGRLCARPTCSRQAVATMSYDQSNCVVYLGGLAPEKEPSFYDMCRFHVDRLTPPTGWTVRRIRPAVVIDDETDHPGAEGDQPALDGWPQTSELISR
jgi:Protein of unknown function (DUF3499)